MDDVHFSSKSTEWWTPQDLFDRLNKEHSFTLDPCATPENAKCEKFYTKEDDGLAKDWRGERVFMNPPYGRGVIDKWVSKATYEAWRGALVVALLPARTDTAWWHDHVIKKATGIEFLRGRVKFLSDGVKVNSAPFPSAIVTFERIDYKYRESFRLIEELEKLLNYIKK